MICTKIFELLAGLGLCWSEFHLNNKPDEVHTNYNYYKIEKILNFIKQNKEKIKTEKVFYL